MAKMDRHAIDFRLESHQPSLLFDARRLSDRISEAMSGDTLPFVVMCSLASSLLMAHAFTEIIFALGLCVYFYSRSAQKKAGLALRMPKSSGLIDPNEISLKDGKPVQSEGIIFMGNDLDSGEEIWMTDTQARTHMLFMGTTGSGKTEYLVSLVYNSLIHGSGFIYVDGKADSSLYGKIYSMARSMGRDDDVLVINFQTGGRDIYGAQSNKLSNTLNPFSNGSSGMLSELVKGLMASGEKSTWTQQAESFVEGLMKPLVYLRDVHGLLLDVNTIREFFELKKLEELAWKYSEIYPGLEESGVLDGVRNYLINKPGYDQDKYHAQGDTTKEQHGYISMQLIRTFNSLADTYGHIMKTPLAEIDFVDVFLNRRILIVLLPALEKSPSELTNLGRIVVASIKSTMAKGLGSKLEGDWAKIIDAKPTNAPSPFICVLDEYGYYAVEGFAVVPAQARSLGFSAVFAGQDLPAFEKASKDEAASTLANTNTRLCGKLECTKTYEYFNNIGGKGSYAKLQTLTANSGSIGMSNYKTEDNVTFDRLDRVSFDTLRGQTSGQWHMFFGNKIIRVRSLFANPKPVKKLRVNHFIKVARPSKTEVEAYQNASHLFARAVESDGGLASYMDRVSSPSDILDILEGFNLFSGDPALLRAGKVMAYCVQRETSRAAEFTNMTMAAFAESADPAMNHLDVLSQMRNKAKSSSQQQDDYLFIDSGEDDAAKSQTPFEARHPVVTGGNANAGTSRSNPFADVGHLFASQPDSTAANPVSGYGRVSAPLADRLADRLEDPSDVFYGLPEDVIRDAEVPDDIQTDDGLDGYGDGWGNDFQATERITLFPESPETTIFGNENSEMPDAVHFADNDVSPDSEDQPFEGIEGDGESELESAYVEQGVLSREVTVSGLAAIERAVGAPSGESLMTASSIAESLAAATTYPMSAPSMKPDMQRFESLAQRLSRQLSLNRQEDEQ
jgi:intracellular multiplication protein IcmO